MTAVGGLSPAAAAAVDVGGATATAADGIASTSMLMTAD